MVRLSILWKTICISFSTILFQFPISWYLEETSFSPLPPSMMMGSFKSISTIETFVDTICLLQILADKINDSKGVILFRTWWSLCIICHLFSLPNFSLCRRWVQIFFDYCPPLTQFNNWYNTWRSKMTIIIIISFEQSCWIRLLLLPCCKFGGQVKFVISWLNCVRRLSWFRFRILLKSVDLQIALRFFFFLPSSSTTRIYMGVAEPKPRNRQDSDSRYRLFNDTRFPDSFTYSHSLVEVDAHEHRRRSWFLSATISSWSTLLYPVHRFRFSWKSWTEPRISSFGIRTRPTFGGILRRLFNALWDGNPAFADGNDSWDNTNSSYRYVKPFD